ncbi:MAG: hypothetical protein ABEK50_18150, partial [bacterium]
STTTIHIPPWSKISGQVPKLKVIENPKSEIKKVPWGHASEEIVNSNYSQKSKFERRGLS